MLSYKSQIADRLASAWPPAEEENHVGKLLKYAPSIATEATLGCLAGRRGRGRNDEIADSSDPNTWGTCYQAHTDYLREYDGVAYVFGEDDPCIGEFIC